MPFSPKVTPLEGHPHIAMEPLTTHEQDGRSNTKVVFSIHTSTHIDSPYHFYADGTTIDQLPLEKFVGRAYLCDLRRVAKPGQALSVADLKAGGLPPEEQLRESRLVLFADWAASRWQGPDLYRGNPYLADDTARWLVDIDLAALALDFAVDGAYPYPCHQILLGAKIPLIENLINLDQIPKKEFTLIALPLKVEGGDGGPARVLAMIE
jgi:kynurenine formamidase